MKIQKHSKKRLIILVALGTALLALAGIVYFLSSPAHNTPTSDKSASDDYNKVDYSPANQTDKTYNDQIKENITPTPNDSPSNSSANIVIVDASQYNDTIEVRSFISNLVENSGTCTFTFTGPGTKVIKTAAATADASTSRCANTKIPVTEFDAKGTWQIVISYSSSSASGKSEPKDIEIR